MPAYAYGVLASGWVLWLLPFVRGKRGTAPAKQVDPRARWGVLLQAVSYGILWQDGFWRRSPQAWQLALCIVFLLLACFLSWSAMRSLGRQWRIDAALSSDHELITSGPYATIRHPIYTSMLCILLGTGFIIASLKLLLLAVAIAIIGTEIRVRTEDKLLASRFGERFREYQSRTAAYIPVLR